MSVPHSDFGNGTGSLSGSLSLCSPLPARTRAVPRSLELSVHGSELLVPRGIRPSQGSLFLSLPARYLLGPVCLPLPAPKDPLAVCWRKGGKKRGREGRNKDFLEPEFLVSVLPWILFYKLWNSWPSLLMLAFVIFAFSCFVWFCFVFLSVFTLQRIQILKLVVFF